MNPQQIRKILLETLDDRQLTRSERKAMDRILEHLEPTPQQLALYRSVAFDLARESLADPHSVETLEWLEEVIRMLEASDSEDHPLPLAEYSFAPEDDCPARISGLLDRARNTVDICVFTITDDRITREILATHSRGINIRVITDDETSLHRGSDTHLLEEAGIPLLFDNDEQHMHNKFAVFDKKVVCTGSYNWTRTAATHNMENILVVYEPSICDNFSREFETLWKRFSKSSSHT